MLPAVRTVDRLTDQQREFVTHYTSTPGVIGNGSEAARRAGYSAKSAGEIARQLLEKKHVRDAIDQANRDAVSGRIAAKAVALLERVIDDESAPIKSRVEAAKTILDRAGLTAPSVAEKLLMNGQRGRIKAVYEMSTEEIEIEIVRLAQEIEAAPTIILEAESETTTLIGHDGTREDGGDNDEI